MREGLAIDVDVVRLLWFVENFFDYEGLHYHEIALYFLLRLPPRRRWRSRRSAVPTLV